VYVCMYVCLYLYCIRASPALIVYAIAFAFASAGGSGEGTGAAQQAPAAGVGVGADVDLPAAGMRHRSVSDVRHFDVEDGGGSGCLTPVMEREGTDRDREGMDRERSIHHI
jgi:hypothetical protein